MFYIGNMPDESTSSQINNYIVDGRLDYWVTASQPVNGYASATMWYNVQSTISGTVLPFVTRAELAINEIPEVPTARYCMLIDPNETTPAATTYVTVNQRIEQVRILAGKVATLSCWMSSAHDGVSVNPLIYYPDGTPVTLPGIPVEVTISQHYTDANGAKTNSVTQIIGVDTSFTRRFISFAVPPLQSEPIDTGYIAITFKFSNESTYKLACIQLEEGSTTDFEELIPQDARFRLNRYYHTSTITGSYAYGAYNSGQVQTFTLPLPTAMRVLPTVTANVSVTNGSGSVAASSVNSAILTVTSSGITPPAPTTPPAPSPAFPAPTTVSATVANFVADARI